MMSCVRVTANLCIFKYVTSSSDFEINRMSVGLSCDWGISNAIQYLCGIISPNKAWTIQI